MRRLGRDPDTGAPQCQILLNNTLLPGQAPRVLAHEIGHAIDETAGQISTVGLNTELRQLYNTLNTGVERTRHLTGPEPLYQGDEVKRELIVEAIRGYMTDPNSIKTVAPKTAAAIRAAVNGHPVLSKVIQFNSLAPLAAVGMGAGAYGLAPSEDQSVDRR